MVSLKPHREQAAGTPHSALRRQGYRTQGRPCQCSATSAPTSHRRCAALMQKRLPPRQPLFGITQYAVLLVAVRNFTLPQLRDLCAAETKGALMQIKGGIARRS